MKKIVISTGGGDAPGLNAVIYAVVHASARKGWEVYGSRNGYGGFLDIDDMVRLTPRDVEGIYSTGGTILGSTNKGNPFSKPVKILQGKFRSLISRIKYCVISIEWVLIAISPLGEMGALILLTGLLKKECL